MSTTTVQSTDRTSLHRRPRDLTIEKEKKFIGITSVLWSREKSLLKLLRYINLGRISVPTLRVVFQTLRSVTRGTYDLRRRLPL